MKIGLVRGVESGNAVERDRAAAGGLVSKLHYTDSVVENVILTAAVLVFLAQQLRLVENNIS